MRFTVLVSLVVVAINVVHRDADRVGARARRVPRQEVRQRADRPAVRTADDRRRARAAGALRTEGPAPFDIGFTRIAVALALLFVTLPFVVRSVQPVLMELDREMEEAATSLGARPRTVFRAVVLPNLVPAIAAGAGLAFARALGEFGSVVLISGNIPFLDRGRLGLPVRPDRVRQHGRRGLGQRRAARAVVPAAAARQLGLDARSAACPLARPPPRRRTRACVEQEDAARTLGASPAQTIRRVRAARDPLGRRLWRDPDDRPRAG